MSAEIACKQNILVTDFHQLKLLLVVLGFGSQTNVCGFSRQNICSVVYLINVLCSFFQIFQRIFCCSTVLSALAMHEKLLKSKLILLTIGVTRISCSKIKSVERKLSKRFVLVIFQICVLLI